MFQDIEARCLAPAEKWLYVRSKDNIADLGTPKGCKIEELKPESEWFLGKPWMTLPAEKFPLKTIEDISLSPEEAREMNKEKFKVNEDFQAHWTYWTLQGASEESSEIGKRYAFSKYLIDPNRFRFKKVIRILALVLLFTRNLMRAWVMRTLRVGDEINELTLVKISQDSRLPTPFSVKEEGQVSGADEVLECEGVCAVQLDDENINNAALTYFFLKGSAEVKHFVKKSKYNDITTEKNGILLLRGQYVTC